MDQPTDYDMIFKIVIIGDSGVGKSNLLSRYLKNEFSLDTKSTVGVEFATQKLEIQNFKVKVQIWDTAGQERYKSITNAYYKGAKGALLVYDITKKETFENIDKWIFELKRNGDEDLTLVLIGNKCDLESQREVCKSIGNDKAMLYNCAFIETSALSAENVNKAFTLMINEIFNKFHKKLNENNDGTSSLSGGQKLVLTEENHNRKNENPNKMNIGCCENI
jgi:Ras-related protein Rab-11A